VHFKGPRGGNAGFRFGAHRRRAQEAGAALQRHRIFTLGWEPKPWPPSVIPGPGGSSMVFVMAKQQTGISDVLPVPSAVAPVPSFEQRTTEPAHGEEQGALAVLDNLATAIFEAYGKPMDLAPHGLSPDRTPR